MSLKRDASFLAGFIVGTYDLKGEATPPAYILPFIDRILEAPEEVVANLTHNQDVIAKTPRIEILNDITISATKPNKPFEEMLADAGVKRMPAAEPSVQILEAAPPPVQNQEEIEHMEQEPPQKERKKWKLTPEQRQAAGDRLRAMHARKKAEALAAGGESPAQGITADKGAFVNSRPTPTITKLPPTSQNVVDSDYIGTRKDSTLSESDWADIKKMRANGMPDARICSSYDIEPDYLDRFSEKMERLDDAKKGNY